METPKPNLLTKENVKTLIAILDYVAEQSAYGNMSLLEFVEFINKLASIRLKLDSMA